MQIAIKLDDIKYKMNHMLVLLYQNFLLCCNYGIRFEEYMVTMINIKTENEHLRHTYTFWYLKSNDALYLPFCKIARELIRKGSLHFITSK